jgi:hypothetical protein
MQNYEQLYFYIHEYQRLIYDYYSKTSIAFLVTYYNLDRENTIWEDEKMYGGYYEKLGELTGVRYNKYVLLPVFFITEVSSVFDGQETGLLKLNESEIVIPSTYGIQPYAHDMIKFEQDYLKITNDIHPILEVTGVEKSVNADRTFWKLKLKTNQSYTTTQADLQTTATYVFYNYTKQIYRIDDAIFLTRLMQKDEYLKQLLKGFYNQNTGFYFV